MNPSLFSYIWRSTRRQQVWILCIILCSMPVTFMLLELPKRIVNGPIQGNGFSEEGARQHFFQIALNLPGWLGGKLNLFSGLSLDRFDSLVALSGAFLGLVLLNGLFKLYINTYKGRLGERMLQQLRYELFDRVLRFPLGEFRRVKAGEISTMIKDEVEPLGGFIGDAYVQPLLLGGQIITALLFIMAQNASLGASAIPLLLVQGVVIPRLRRKQIELGRQRQITARALAGRISEVVEDIPNIRINDTADYQRADIASRLSEIFWIRFSLYQWKFFIKFLNNLLAQVTPFLFYLIGGYYAIRGQLDIGQLVAVIAAYKDLPSPVKELIDWDQQRLDVEVKYRQVVEQFTVPGLLECRRGNGDEPAFDGDLVVSGLSMVDYSGGRLLDGLSFRMKLDEIVAVIGPARGGGETLAEVLARLLSPTSGRVQIGGRDMADWPDAVMGRRVSYAGPDTYFPQSTIAEALLAGLRHGPPVPPGDGSWMVIDTGGLDLNFRGDWVNYNLAGVDGPDTLRQRLAEVLNVVDLYGDVVKLGLNRPLSGESVADTGARFVEARKRLRDKLAEGNMTDLVEPFDPDRYNWQSSVAENLLFGTANDPAFERAALPGNRVVRAILDRHGLSADLFEMGKAIAQTILEVFEGLAPDNPLFARLALVGPDRLPAFAAALGRIGDMAYARLAEEDRTLFLELAFNYVEPRDRLGVLDQAMQERIVEARRGFRESLGRNQVLVAFYDPEAYNPAASIQDNILLGRVAHGTAQAESRVLAAMQDVIEQLSLDSLIFGSGLCFNIGNGGRRLTSAQRQKLALARAILRRPALLIAHRCLASLDVASQAAIFERVVRIARGEEGGDRFGVLCFLSDARFAERFSRVLVLEDGKLAEDGKPEELKESGGYLMKMVA